ncbi:MAG: hypothetical protein ACRBDL_07640 [Alphaproteobacteria bacterium]
MDDSLRNAFLNLANSSPDFDDLIGDIYDDGGNVDIKIVDDIPGGDGSRTSYDPQAGKAEILIEKDAFQGDEYIDENGNDQKMSLERILAEELKHVSHVDFHRQNE